MSKNRSEDNIAPAPVKKIGVKKPVDGEAVPEKKYARANLSAQQIGQLAKWYETTGSYARTSVLARDNGIHISATSIANKLKERQKYLESAQ